MRSVPVSKSFCDPSFAVVERKNVSGWEYPFGTPGSPLSSGTGSFRTICLSPCLHQRLLLWNEQGSYSVFFTDRRAGDPYGCSVAVGGVSGKNGKSVTVGLAVEGHLIGEMASAAFTFLALFLVPPQRKERQNETLMRGNRQAEAGAEAC